MINKDYIYTSTILSVDDFTPQENSTFLYGYSSEQRSHFVDALISKYGTTIDFVEIEDIGNDKILDKTSGEAYLLRSPNNILDFLQKHNLTNLYIDVSGLDNRICASLLNNAVKLMKMSIIINIRVLYAEPSTYDIKQFATEGVFHDLSEQIEGIKPLPGFATIIPDDVDDIQLIALLGFEGGRFSYLIENIPPPRDNVIPVIGVPGYRMEYPFVAYWGNRRPLLETDTWRQIKFASANSIVEIYFLLVSILKKSQNHKIKVAPIGTKPHAIGAMLFAIKYPDKVELIYDNPIRKKKRTSGIGHVVECFISKLLKEN